MNTNYSIPIVNLVAQRIDKLRIEQSLSLRELAKKSGISHSTLSNIIQATKIPNIYTLANISSTPSESKASSKDFCLFSPESSLYIL